MLLSLCSYAAIIAIDPSEVCSLAHWQWTKLHTLGHRQKKPGTSSSGLRSLCKLQITLLPAFSAYDFVNITTTPFFMLRKVIKIFRIFTVIIKWTHKFLPVFIVYPYKAFISVHGSTPLWYLLGAPNKEFLNFNHARNSVKNHIHILLEIGANSKEH